MAWTPRTLLEARYKAFTEGNIDFIVETHHPETRNQLNRESLNAWAKDSVWLGLKIDDEKVESQKASLDFTVRYRRGYETVNHREIAEFRKENGDWFYFDSEFPKPETLKSGDQPGRNDLCSCGSQKKYKKCCGLKA